MPWMDTPKSDFVSALENFWNGWANMRDDIVLVACGSATSWMVDKLLHNQGGLFNRITQKIYLRPFKLSEMEQYLDEKHFGWNRYQIAQCYMILGGIPFYLTLLNPKLSLLSNIDELFLQMLMPCCEPNIMNCIPPCSNVQTTILQSSGC